MLKRILSAVAVFITSLTTAAWACPPQFNNTQAIHIAETAMNTWFGGVEKGDLQAVSDLFAPNIIVLHSIGAPITKAQQMQLMQGFHLGGYHFSDFCAAQTGDTIVATFASKTFKHDIAQNGLNFLSNHKAYRMVVLQKINQQWLIIGYANTNPLTQEKNPHAHS